MCLSIAEPLFSPQDSAVAASPVPLLVQFPPPASNFLSNPRVRETHAKLLALFLYALRRPEVYVLCSAPHLKFVWMSRFVDAQ